MTVAGIDLALIGGTGLYGFEGLQDVESHQPVTRYGALSGPVHVGTLAGRRVVRGREVECARYYDTVDGLFAGA